MSGKRNWSDIDPDYEDVTAVEKKRKCVLQDDAKGAVTEKIVGILQCEFTKEIQYKEHEVNNIDKKLHEAKKTIDRLRACIVASYYYPVSQHTQSTSVNSEFGLHPAVAKYAGSNQSNIIKSECKVDISGATNPASSACTNLSSASEIITPEIRRPLQVKRQKIIIGNVSKYITENQRETADPSTHKWMLYVRGPRDAPNIDHVVMKMIFFLHPSYRPNDIVEVSQPPFHLTRRGWGEFPVRIQLQMRGERNKKVDVIHHLKLDKTYTGLQTLGAETVIEVDLDEVANERTGNFNGIESAEKSVLNDLDISEHLTIQHNAFCPNTKLKHEITTRMKEKYKHDQRDMNIRNDNEEDMNIQMIDDGVMDIPRENYVKNRNREIHNKHLQSGTSSENCDSNFTMLLQKTQIKSEPIDFYEYDSGIGNQRIDLSIVKQEFNEDSCDREGDGQSNRCIIDDNHVLSNETDGNLTSSCGLINDVPVLKSNIPPTGEIDSTNLCSVSKTMIKKNNQWSNIESLNCRQNDKDPNLIFNNVKNIMKLNEKLRDNHEAKTTLNILNHCEKNGKIILKSVNAQSNVGVLNVYKNCTITSKDVGNNSDGFPKNCSMNNVKNNHPRDSEKLKAMHIKMPKLLRIEKNNSASENFVPSKSNQNFKRIFIPRPMNSINISLNSTFNNPVSSNNCDKNVTVLNANINATENTSSGKKFVSLLGNQVKSLVKMPNSLNNVNKNDNSKLCGDTMNFSALKNGMTFSRNLQQIANNVKIHSEKNISQTKSTIFPQNSVDGNSEKMLNSQNNCSKSTLFRSNHILSDNISLNISPNKTLHGASKRLTNHQSPSIFGFISKNILSESKSILGIKKRAADSLNIVSTPIDRPISVCNMSTVPDLLRAFLPHFPLISRDVSRQKHPYCAKSVPQWLSWGLGKRRSTEWQRALAVRRYTDRLISQQDQSVIKPEHVWSTKRIMMWCRQHAFSPHYMEILSTRESSEENTSLPLSGKLNSYTDVSRVLEQLRQLNCDNQPREMESALVDVERLDAVAYKKVITKPSTRETIATMVPSDEAAYVQDITRKVGIKFEPVAVEEHDTAPLVEEMLYSMGERFMEDILRASFTQIYTGQKCRDEISVTDLYNGIRSIPEGDFLTNAHLGVTIATKQSSSNS